MHNIDPWNFIGATMPVWSPLASGLVAALTVHVLTQHREWERWLLDSKKQEFKELLTALSESYVTVLSLKASGFFISNAQIPGGIGSNPMDEQRYRDSVDNLARVVRSRLFIVKDLQLEK